jgi:hypothetical protein
MLNRRTIAWSSAMRSLRHQPAARAAIREERLRAAAALREGSLPLSAWRGRSGRRYVVGVHPLDDAALDEAADAVVLAVAREPDGGGRLVRAASVEADVGAGFGKGWIADARARGATELHVHRLVDDAAERRAVVADVTEVEGEVA